MPGFMAYHNGLHSYKTLSQRSLSRTDTVDISGYENRLFLLSSRPEVGLSSFNAPVHRKY